MAPIPTIAIEGYLVQNKLELALKTLIAPDAWRGAEVPVSAGRRHRWDMSYEHQGRVVVVEYDGDEHYRNSLKIKTDREKDEAARAAGYQVVRFPYWLQLTSETLRHFFKLEARVVQDFPHGFITTRILPASFCELGVARFAAEMADLPANVAAQVTASLRARVAEHGETYVVPTALRPMLDLHVEDGVGASR